MNKYADLRDMRLQNENTAKSYRDEVFKLANQTASDLKSKIRIKETH